MSKSSLQVVPGTAQVLSPQQEKFNSLMENIGKQRELLREWEMAIEQFRQRYVAELLPLQQKDLVLKEQLLRLYDRLSDQKLARADQVHLAMRICDYVYEVLASVHDEAKIAELKAIFNRHSEGDGEEQQSAQPDGVAQQWYELPLDGDGQDTPEAELHRLAQQMQQEVDAQEAWMEAAAAERARDKARRKHAAKVRKQQEADKQASQSVREVYRKLVSSLHPDREADPTERERKTELMQRVNQAYAAGQLLQLLELQLEVEQINAKHMAGLSEERLKHYNQVLNEQWREIKREVELMGDTFKANFGIASSEKLLPKKLRPLLAAEVAARKHNLLVLGMQLNVFSQDPSQFKDWLKEDRQYYRE